MQSLHGCQHPTLGAKKHYVQSRSWDVFIHILERSMIDSWKSVNFVPTECLMCLCLFSVARAGQHVHIPRSWSKAWHWLCASASKTDACLDLQHLKSQQMCSTKSQPSLVLLEPSVSEWNQEVPHQSQAGELSLHWKTLHDFCRPLAGVLTEWDMLSVKAVRCCCRCVLFFLKPITCYRRR